MLDLKSLNLQFVTDDEGKKQAVILPMDEFIELLEDLEDLALMAERREERGIPFNQVINQFDTGEQLN